jgi:phosphatidate phosphatase PAH1
MHGINEFKSATLSFSLPSVSFPRLFSFSLPLLKICFHFLQGDVTLPDGPLFLNPESLIHAFRKEVIDRNPEEFKIRYALGLNEQFHEIRQNCDNRIRDILVRIRIRGSVQLC